MALAVLLSFIVELHAGYPEAHARTLALTMFVMLSFFQVFSSRGENQSLFQPKLLANKPLLYTSLAALALHWAVMSWPFSANVLGLTPLTASEWLLCTAVGSTVLLRGQRFRARITRASAWPATQTNGIPTISSEMMFGSKRTVPPDLT